MSELKHVLIIGLFWGMLVPAITTAEGIPHGLRSIGTVPSAYILAAVGLAYISKKALGVWHYPWMEKLYWLVAACFLATLVFVSYAQYFVFAKNSSDNYFAFRSDLSTVSEYINNHPDQEKNMLVLDLFSEQTVQYLTEKTNHPYIIIDPENSPKVKLKQGDRLIFTASTLFDAVKFHDRRDLKIVEYKNNALGDTDMIVYEKTSNDSTPSLSFNSDKSFWALNLGDKIYFSWKNQSLNSWKIDIFKCADAQCSDSEMIKENNQNDYFANTDHIDTTAAKTDLYFKAIGYGPGDKVIKDFGIIKVNPYK